MKIGVFMDQIRDTRIKKSLEFAPLVRVSTERQEKQGESLNTQRTQLEAAVERMGGGQRDECCRIYKGVYPGSSKRRGESSNAGRGYRKARSRTRIHVDRGLP